MGKAARNRARRREQAARDAQREAVRDAVVEVMQLDSVEAFTNMLARRPDLLGETAIEELRSLSEIPGYGPLVAIARQLLDGARDDPRTAWEEFARSRELSNAAGQDLAAFKEQIDLAQAAGELPRALELIDDALPVAREIGFGLALCELLAHRGSLLCQLNSARRAEEIDEALEAFEGALTVAVPGEQAARILMHRGLAYSERVNGDPGENGDRAIVSVRDGLAQLAESGDDGLRAMMQTNLAVALVRRGRDRTANAREAVDLCRQALSYRSPERDPDDWAYSQINLGYGLLTLFEEGEGHAEEARAVYMEVLAHAELISDAALVGEAHLGLGRLNLRAAHHTPEDMVGAHAAGELEDLYDDTASLHSARDHLQTAVELTPVARDPLRYARILDDLSSALEQLGEEDDALAVAQEALGLVTPRSAPVVCKNVGWRVGALLGKRHDWAGAAAAFRAALEGTEFTLNALIDTAAREEEIRGAGNLHRWAAYAFAQAGDAEGAALTLDSGRARELQRRLGIPGSDELALGQVPTELRDFYETALAAVIASPIDGMDTIATRRLGEAIAVIRELPGLSRFRSGPQWSEIIGAIDSDWPLVYVNPTPSGTLFLLLHEREGAVGVTAEFISVTSTEIFMHLFVGREDVDAALAAAGGSYLIGATAQGRPDHDLARDLDDLLPWLGETIADPLAELLQRVGATAATLVLCGPLGSAPLHAAPIGSGAEIFADQFALRYVPSAVVCSAAITRARTASKRPLRLVALADPLGDLSAAGPEVEEVAALFGSPRSTCVAGASATRRFLELHAGQASHVHLACHARGGLFDASEAAILLASGPLPATEVTALARLSARLVVISACQSTQSTIAGLPHEELSLATAMLAAGSACTIASLWPVDDLATALLMTHLYQELLIRQNAPPHALREAQLWLRDLSDDEEQQFLDRHPQLTIEYSRRVAAGNPPGRRGNAPSRAQSGPERPYAHPEFWAPFIAVGV